MKRAATILNEEKNFIMERWETEVSDTIPASHFSESLVLRDHLPDLLDDIIEILSHKEESAREGMYRRIEEHSKEHGRHRASSSHYTISQILHEYILFHQILTELLTERGVFTEKVGAAVKYSLESSMLYSAKAFNDSLQEMQEKLIGILAHDMRNPISAALFAVDMMKPGQDQERFEKLRNMTRNGLKRTMDLIESLLDSVTVSAGQGMALDFKEVNIIEFIDAVYEEAAEVYSSRIDLKKPSGAVTGVFDGTMVRRMMENLISNAVKYGSRETPVNLSVEDQDERVLLKVHNFGNPIAEENRKRIFQFLDSDLSNGALKSWGMGLTLVKAVAEAHGGKVEVESSKEKGTTFLVSLHKNSNSPGKKRAALNFR